MSTKKPQPTMTILSSNEEANAITERNQRESPLLKLPGEIRNRIYKYAVGGHRIWLPSPEGLYPDRVTAHMDPTLHCYPASSVFNLSRTCRQTYSESKLLIFHANEFGFHNHYADDDYEYAEDRFPLYFRDDQLKEIKMIWCFDESSELATATIIPFDKLPKLEQISYQGSCYGADKADHPNHDIVRDRIRASVPDHVRVIVECVGVENHAAFRRYLKSFKYCINLDDPLIEKEFTLLGWQKYVDAL